MKHLKIIAILGAVLTSCADHPAECVNSNRPLNDEETRIVEIARREVVPDEKSLERVEFGLPKHEADGSWFIRVWRLPKTPGGFVTVVINENGTIREVIAGK